MKRIITVALLLTGAFSFAQTETGKKVERMTVYKWENNRTTAVESNAKKEMTKEEEIAYCENMISALDEKEAVLRSNPAQLVQATEEGWFEKAEATRGEMKARILELKK